MIKRNMDKAIFAEMRDALTARRAELIDLRQSLTHTWQDLNRPESELEETASKATLSRGVQRRSEAAQAELRDIDRALTRMAEGEYGHCSACGRPIRVQRLKAVPSTRHCVKCAGMREAFDAGAIEAPTVVVGEGELTDDDIREAILDDLQTDGRVETEELVVACEDGVVYLEGLLPSEVQRQILLEIVQDVLDLENVVDGIRIDRQPWERHERRPDHRGSDAWNAEALTGEAGGEVDPHTALETGEPMTPPDELIPENPES